VHAGKHHLTAFFVMQIDAGFHAAKGPGHVIHNIVDELIEIENRRDLLRRFLQFAGDLLPVQLSGRHARVERK
jgi:hypothetical protein